MNTSAPARISRLCPARPDQDAVTTLLAVLAGARGCGTPAEVQAFLDPAPAVENPLPVLRETRRAVDRLAWAMRAGETVTIFSDYDCDGVTSAAQCVNLMRAAGYTNYRVYIPDRFIEDYGLTAAALDRCLNEQHPTLILATDCGSGARDELRVLKARGVDVIVLDHHQVGPGGDHPAYAHLNPKADPAFASSATVQEAARMSAAGLTYFFCQLVAAELGVAWDAEANLLLAGLGTYVDVMPLTGLNRGLVKHSLRLANSPVVQRLPGIVALLQATGWSGRSVTDYTYGFILGPCLNATGRMTHARASLSLLCSRDPAAAQERARALTASNQERKQVQDGVCREAFAQAAQIMAEDPATKILALSAPHWHSGIVGIVAGRVRERFHRPVIALGRLDHGIWKGSGRSVDTVDLGSLVAQAVQAGVVAGGGGHPMACGVKLSDAQLPGFLAWIRERAQRLEADLTPSFEVIGDAGWLTGDQWLDFFTRGAPFGQGNPRPLIVLDADDLAWGPEMATKHDGSAWALRAGFAAPGLGELTVVWTDMDRARLVLAPGQKVRLMLEFSRGTGSNGRRYDNWYVQRGEHRDG
jgi:single-stranded-DNA-specific exonuclease